MLLVGNQGVGKNKIADKLLQLMNRPREYIQLHRDTTVQTLTLQPTVRDGIVIYEDSPLVKVCEHVPLIFTFIYRTYSAGCKKWLHFGC